MPARPDIAVKVFDCDTEDTEDCARSEAAAMKAVQSLDGCLWLHDMYASVTDPELGGASYYLSMPCAPRPLSW